MTTLLHACCGPCASACVPRLRERGREVTLLFANSNIDTREEFEKRLAEARKLATADGVKIVALPYDHGEWLREVADGFEGEPEKGARCARCFRYNLGKTAEYAAANGYDEFTTSLTVSPHKVSKMIFEAGREAGLPRPRCAFLPEDFKKREGFKVSVRRAGELGLYRQAYCGCEFSKWRLHHKRETASTNQDARAGVPGDVFTADYQTAGRGRLDHAWLSPPGTNLMMSVVLSVAGLQPERVATLPLVIGLAVAKSLVPFLPTSGLPRPLLKWPNDVLVGDGKIAGILCERQGDNVIVGIGVNVNQTAFPREIADRATSLAILSRGRSASVGRVRDALLAQIDACHRVWKERGFDVLYPELREMDSLRGKVLAVRQTDGDEEPVRGVCGGILPDGALDVGGRCVYAGEAHVEKVIGQGG